MSHAVGLCLLLVDLGLSFVRSGMMRFSATEGKGHLVRCVYKVIVDNYHANTSIRTRSYVRDEVLGRKHCLLHDRNGVLEPE